MVVSRPAAPPGDGCARSRKSRICTIIVLWQDLARPSTLPPSPRSGLPETTLGHAGSGRRRELVLHKTANYGTNLRALGVVDRVLTRAAHYPRGFKVRLTSGVVGRVTEIVQASGREQVASTVKGAARDPKEPTTDRLRGERRKTYGRDGRRTRTEAYLASILANPPVPGIRLRDA